jgi:hypothetical protein
VGPNTSGVEEKPRIHATEIQKVLGSTGMDDLGLFENEVYQKQQLVGGLEHEFYDFPYIGNFITPTDFHSITNQIGISSNI